MSRDLKGLESKYGQKHGKTTDLHTVEIWARIAAYKYWKIWSSLSYGLLMQRCL